MDFLNAANFLKHEELDPEDYDKMKEWYDFSHIRLILS